MKIQKFIIILSHAEMDCSIQIGQVYVVYRIRWWDYWWTCLQS